MTGSYVVGLGDTINRAVLSALAAADTLIFINYDGKKALTYARRTLLVYNVSDILVTEELKSCKNGVGSNFQEVMKGVR